MQTFQVRTSGRTQLVNITGMVESAVAATGKRDGAVTVFVPHTTAGITINENADPDVCHDLLLKLDRLVPRNEAGYRHGEGNSDAHLKASLLGSSVQVIFEAAKLRLGTWQGIFLAEFDGPREREVWVTVTG